jgi:drug/metabolite transporter (DMT)-like permease
MSRWRQAPWPVIFVVCTVMFAVLAQAWAQIADPGTTGLWAAAPFFGAAMTWWFVRQRNQEREQAGFDADQHREVEQAVLHGQAPADPVGWPGARTVVARHREQLHRYRWTPLLFGLLGLAFLALGAADDVRSDYLAGAVMCLVAGVGTLSSARLRRNLAAAEAALDAAESR